MEKPASTTNPRKEVKMRKQQDSQLYRDLSDAIDTVDLPDMSKRFLRSRWLDQLMWMDTRATEARARYYALRICGFCAGAVIPLLAAYDIVGYGVSLSRLAIAVLGLVVVMASGLEGLLKYGDRWRQYRWSAELLKTEGWRFLQLADPYNHFQTHAEAYPHFSDHVEDTLRRDVQTYIAGIKDTGSVKAASGSS